MNIPDKLIAFVENHLRAKRLMADVKMLSHEIGERNIECYQNLIAAETFIMNTLDKLGYKIRIESYEVNGLRVANIEAERTGTHKPEEIIIVGAHYDTAIGTGGADDNTSGTVGVIELARMFRNYQPERTVRFVLFVLEEPPHFFTSEMGSRVYALACRQRDENIVGMICLDCIGYYSDASNSQQIPCPLDASMYPSTGNFIMFVSNEESSALYKKCINEFRETTDFPCEGNVANETESPSWLSWSDHANFWFQNYPAVMVTDTALFRSSTYHLTTDTWEKLDYKRMSRVIGGIYNVVWNLLNN